jgi:hypothetical protein
MVAANIRNRISMQPMIEEVNRGALRIAGGALKFTPQNGRLLFLNVLNRHFWQCFMFG